MLLSMYRATRVSSVEGERAGEQHEERGTDMGELINL